MGAQVAAESLLRNEAAAVASRRDDARNAWISPQGRAGSSSRKGCGAVTDKKIGRLGPIANSACHPAARR